MFAVLHVADFALHAVLRTEAGTAGHPAALFSENGKKSVVLAANPAARAAGVERGMTTPQAVARCATLLIRSPRAAAEAEARAALLAIGFTLSPAIEDTAPGICTLDLKGADAARLVAALQSAVAALDTQGLPATAGLAATPLLALYAARSGRSGLRPDPIAADTLRQESESSALCAPILPTGQVADLTYPGSLQSPHLPSAASLPVSRLQSPVFRHSPSVLHITDASGFLGPLPLAAADPSPELAAVLANWGLRTLGDLTALPRDEIVRRFGTEGFALWQRATGGAARPLHPVMLAQEFAAAMDLEDAVETLEPLLFLLRRFLDRLALELRASQHVAAELHLALALEDETQHARSFRLPEPTADPEILFRALHTHLESLTTAASIVGLRLQLTPARPLVRQQGLFETGLRDPHGFAETLARVSALVGADRVGTPQLEDTHRPDAVKLTAPLAVIPPPAEPPLYPPLGVPLRRFRPPLPARVEFTEGRATYVWTERVQGEIAARSTAYPSSGDWWQQDRAWTRTEWDIALAGGGLYRLLRVDDAWFIEGEYD